MNDHTPAVFCFESQNVRTVKIDGEPWLVAADVCNGLGITNNRNATSRLDDDEKGVRLVDTPSGQQQMTIVNESGLYSLILRSDKPEAKRFKKWVTSEVLPAIRKTGSYGQTLDPSLRQISANRYIELLESENIMLRNGAPDTKTPAKEKSSYKSRKRLLDTTGVNKMLYDKYLVDHSGKAVINWWRETNIPLSMETVTATLLRNRSMSPTTIAVVARALKFTTHDIRMMLLKLKGGEATLLLT